MFKVNNKDTRMAPLACSSVFTVDFEQEIPAGLISFFIFIVSKMLVLLRFLKFI